MKKTKSFKIYEFVCPDVYKRDGEDAFRYFRPVLLDFMDWFRKEQGRPVYVNNWWWKGPQTQRGLRCNLCKIVVSKKVLYVSGHISGSAVDFNVKDIHPDETRVWLEKNIHRFFEEYPQYIAKCRLESKEYAPTWVHIDFYDHDGEGIILYIKPIGL
ncbi:MAG: hypothetical protein M0R03_23715 [Novosphingobium sp.]|nr:hypothetical protein [Novosphingobium sp.]